MFIFILLVALVIIYILTNKNCSIDNNEQKSQENFVCPCKSRKDKKYNKYNKYPYEPKIQTPQSNYDTIIEKINSQQAYKKDLSVALSPTPTIHCPELNNIEDCNKYGCNWFGTNSKKNSNSFCSSTYPTQL